MLFFAIDRRIEWLFSYLKDPWKFAIIRVPEFQIVKDSFAMTLFFVMETHLESFQSYIFSLSRGKDGLSVSILYRHINVFVEKLLSVGTVFRMSVEFFLYSLCDLKIMYDSFCLPSIRIVCHNNCIATRISKSYSFIFAKKKNSLQINMLLQKKLCWRKKKPEYFFRLLK